LREGPHGCTDLTPFSRPWVHTKEEGTARTLLEKNDPGLSLFRFHFLTLAIGTPALDQICLHKNTILNYHEFLKHLMVRSG
jgi:hypothetical protein